jgi:predicted transcriptional regulator/fibronectin type 3 domain-containing protein
MGRNSYKAYPAVLLPNRATTFMIEAFYPNPSRTGYLDAQVVQSGSSSGGTFADLDGDDDLDFVCANREGDSQIFWGNGSGTWSNVNITNLSTEGYCHAYTGDFNGDGHVDIVFRGGSSTEYYAQVFLNKGDGKFNSTLDIKIPAGDHTIGDPPGDFNTDGYDDILIVERYGTTNKVKCYFGGPNGPDATADITYPMGERGRAYLEDINNDGHLDIVLGANLGGQSHVYLGGKNGPDTTVDYRLTVPGNSQRVAAGDINGDTFCDLVFSYYESSSNMGMIIFTGAATGWTTTRSYSITQVPSDVIALEVLDIDLNGYEDILGVVRGDSLRVYFGGTTWPTSPGITKSTRCNPFQIAVAAPRRATINATLPSPPLNLSAIARDKSVKLIWEQPMDKGGVRLLRYNVYRGSSKENLILYDTQAFDVPAYDDSTVVNGQTYFYAVTAVNSKGESNRSNIVNATPLGTPLAPMDFTLTPGCATVQINWSQPFETGGLPILGYRLQRGTRMARLDHLIDLDNVTGYLDEGLENGRAYYYRLCAFNLLGNGTFTRVESAMPVGPPAAPYALTAIPGDGQVALSWREPLSDGGKAITGYLLLKGSTEGSLEPLVNVDGYATSFVDLEVTNGVTYFYAVLAFNEIGDGPLSQVINASPLGLPGSPSNLVAEGADGQVILSWEAPEQDGGTPVLGYALYRGLSETTIGLIIQVDGTTYADTGLLNGETYYYKVAAYNRIGEGLLSEVASATPLALPEAPRSLDIEVDIGQVTVQWLRPLETGGAPITAYRVYRGESPDDHVLIKEVGSAVTRFTDVDVVGGVTYYYKVTAVTAAGEGPASEVIPGMPLGPPGPPLDLVAEAGDGEVILSWAMSESDGGLAVLGYAIHRDSVGASLVEIARLGNVLSYTDTDVENGRTYLYSVLAYNDAGDGPLPEPIEASPVQRLFAPGVIRDLQAKAKGDGVTLTWISPASDGGSPLTGYEVLRGTSPDDLQTISELGVLLTFTDEGFDRGRTYSYAIIARNAVGQGERSEVVSVEVGKREETGAVIKPVFIVAVPIAIILVVLGALATTEYFRYWWALSVVPLFSRLAKEEVLDNRTRYLMHGVILENPGIHFHALLREFDISTGAAVYHLDVLKRENFIRSVRDGRLKRFYSTNTKVPKDHRKTPEEVREAIQDLVTDQPGISQKEIINELGIDRTAVGYHLRELVKEGKIQDSKEGQYTVYHPPT